MDLDVDVDVDADADAEVSAGAQVSWWIGTLRFLNLGKLPFMILFSLFILSAWSISVLLNHEGSFYNPENRITLALISLLPNILLSALIMKILSSPLVPIFAKLDTSVKAIDYKGKVGTVLTEIAPDSMGQIKVFVNDSVSTISAKSIEKEIKKGQKVLIVDEIKQENCFVVVPADEH